MGYRPLVVLCLPLSDLHHFCLTKRFPKTHSAIYRSERHLHFALIRLCLALLFIISILHGRDVERGVGKAYVPPLLEAPQMFVTKVTTHPPDFQTLRNPYMVEVFM